MNEKELFSYQIYEEETHLAERELAAFIMAATERLGLEQAGAAMADWLDESDLADTPPLSISRNWHSVSIAASARLPHQANVRQRRQTSLPASTDTKVSFIPSFNCFTSTLLV
jgi:hypothetical protein